VADEYAISIDTSSPLISGSVESQGGELGYYIVFTRGVERWCDENLEFPVDARSSMTPTATDITLVFGSEADATAFRLKWM
jgi:hypothetical protein